MALRQGDSVGLKESEDFIFLHLSEFTDKMASAPRASYRRRGNTLSQFPDEDDWRLLRYYQQNRMNSLVEAMKHDPTEFQWCELAEVTLSRILVFNARRGSEAAELTLEDYA
jgi:hypothetical protein